MTLDGLTHLLMRLDNNLDNQAVFVNFLSTEVMASSANCIFQSIITMWIQKCKRSKRQRTEPIKAFVLQRTLEFGSQQTNKKDIIVKTNNNIVPLQKPLLQNHQK